MVLIGGWGELTVSHSGRLHRGRAFAVGQQLLHSVQADHGLYSLNLDPVHPLCRRLRREHSKSGPVWNLSRRLRISVANRIKAAIERPLDCRRAHALSDAVLKIMFPGPIHAASDALDPRISRVTSWLRTHIPERVNLAELALACQLSPGHLTHLFKQEMGVPIKSYLLAMRMRKAAEYFGAGTSLTEVAHKMGFTDSAHMTRAFQAYFSIPPSRLVNREIVDVQVCEPN